MSVSGRKRRSLRFRLLVFIGFAAVSQALIAMSTVRDMLNIDGFPHESARGNFILIAGMMVLAAYFLSISPALAARFLIFKKSLHTAIAAVCSLIAFAAMMKIFLACAGAVAATWFYVLRANSDDSRDLERSAA
jgi:hypothetical protein